MILVKINWTAPKILPICIAILCRLIFSVTHDQTVHIKLNVFVYSSLFRVPRPFIILHTLPPSPKFSSTFIHCAVRKRLLIKIPKGFNEVVINSETSLFTEVLYDCSNFVHFCSLTHPSPVCSEFLLKSIALKFYSSSKMLNKIKLSTEWSFISIYSF